MPWRSDQQRKWGHTAAGKKALGGEAAVKEWDTATKGKKLPHKVSKGELAKQTSGSFGLSEKAPKSTSARMPNPAKTGIPSVRTPKAKKMPSAFDKPSVFFKSEDIKPKHPSVQKLWDFMQRRQSRSQS